MVNKIKPTTNQPSPLDPMSLLISSIASRISIDPCIPLILRIINENKNVGFRGHVCNKCLTCWIEPVYSNDGGMKSLLFTKPHSHSCDPKKVVDAQKVQDIKTKKNELENQLVTFLVYLTFTCSLFCAKKLYLVTEELICPPYSVTNIL